MKNKIIVLFLVITIAFGTIGCHQSNCYLQSVAGGSTMCQEK